MKVTNKELFTIIEAEENYILVHKKTGEGAFLIYLGKYDSPDNYEEIPESEYVEPVIEEPEM